MSPPGPPPVLFGAVAGGWWRWSSAGDGLGRPPPPRLPATAVAARSRPRCRSAPPASTSTPPRPRRARRRSGRRRAGPTTRGASGRSRHSRCRLAHRSPPDAVDAEVARPTPGGAAAAGQQPPARRLPRAGPRLRQLLRRRRHGRRDYRAWIRAVAGALAGSAATVVLEPDAVAHEVTGCGAGDAAPGAAGRRGQVLKAAGPVTVYLDAGNPGFVTDIDALADALRRSGVAEADGFSLNVANFYATAEVLAYGHGAVGGTRRGALRGGHQPQRQRPHPTATSTAARRSATRPAAPWARPPTTTPATRSSTPTCGSSGWASRTGPAGRASPPAGQWWPEYALGLALRVA